MRLSHGRAGSRAVDLVLIARVTHAALPDNTCGDLRFGFTENS